MQMMQAMWACSLGWADPLEKEMAIHSSILENSMDRGDWWAIDHGVAKSWTCLSTHACMVGRQSFQAVATLCCGSMRLQITNGLSCKRLSSTSQLSRGNSREVKIRVCWASLVAEW